MGGGKANNPDETQKQQKLLVSTIVLGFHLFFVGHNDGNHFLTRFQMVHDI